MDFPKLPKVFELNEKIKEVGEELGVDSKLYKDYANYIKENFKNSYKINNKSGIIQLDNDFELTGEVQELRAYSKLVRMPGMEEVYKRGASFMGDAIKDYQKKENLKHAREVYAYNKYLEMYKEMEFIQDTFDSRFNLLYEYMSKDYTKALEIMRIKGRKKTFEELQTVAKTLNNDSILEEAEPIIQNL